MAFHEIIGGHRSSLRGAAQAGVLALQAEVLPEPKPEPKPEDHNEEYEQVLQAAAAVVTAAAVELEAEQQDELIVIEPETEVLTPTA